MLKLSAKLKNNQAYLMYWAIVCALCVGVVACSDSALTRPEANDGGEASFFIRSKVVAATLSRAEVVITGSNMDEIRQDLTIDGDVITGIVQNIPAGEERRFVLNGYDSSGNLAYSGSAIADVVAGEQVTIRITMRKQGDKIYWMDSKIRRALLDGSQIEDLVSIGTNEAAGLALDVSSSKMYWAEYYSDKIRRANLDGSQAEDLAVKLDNPVWLVLDVDGGKMYWIETGKIRRANFDGSQIEDLVSTGLSEPGGLALDVSSSKMYWADQGTSKIQRANLDGSQIENLIITGLSEPAGLALDVSSGKMYWADQTADKIQRANLDGSQIEDLVIDQNKVDNPRVLTLDVDSGKMYWAEWGKIRRANIDGSQIEDFITTGSGSITGLALDVGGGGQ